MEIVSPTVPEKFTVTGEAVVESSASVNSVVPVVTFWMLNSATPFEI